MAFSLSDRVLVVGAGLGGLVLAQGLKKQGIAFSIFERDNTPDQRSQGYRIKLFPDCVTDLKYLLPPELWHDFEDTCANTVSGETLLNALDASPIASRAAPGGPPVYTVDRGVLRGVLMKGLEKELHLGKAFVRYEFQGNQVVAHFEDGSTEMGALLVGADGHRSLVRKQYLPEQRTVSTEGVCIFGKTPLTAELLERFPSKHLRWLTLCRDMTPLIPEILFGESPITLFVEAMRFQNRDTQNDLPADYVYWGMVLPRKVLASTDGMLSAQFKKPAKDLSLLITSEWDSSIRSLLELQDDSQTSAIRTVSADPNMLAWTPTARVTLVGDAIHVMSPTGGVGAVTALRDAALLTRTLAEAGLSVASIGSYESAMRVYAGANIRRSFAAGKRFFNMPPFESCEGINH